mmetsp:Transcript_63234/g.186966  ORF Transcript_63234/g.186966 Transcript_63234/m.186966 type:complete len:258 (+) Transcript_63234:2425-3198(+)
MSRARTSSSASLERIESRSHSQRRVRREKWSIPSSTRERKNCRRKRGLPLVFLRTSSDSGPTMRGSTRRVSAMAAQQDSASIDPTGTPTIEAPFFTMSCSLRPGGDAPPTSAVDISALLHDPISRNGGLCGSVARKATSSRLSSSAQCRSSRKRTRGRRRVATARTNFRKRNLMRFRAALPLASEQDERSASPTRPERAGIVSIRTRLSTPSASWMASLASLISSSDPSSRILMQQSPKAEAIPESGSGLRISSNFP